MIKIYLFIFIVQVYVGIYYLFVTLETDGKSMKYY